MGLWSLDGVGRSVCATSVRGEATDRDRPDMLCGGLKQALSDAGEAPGGILASLYGFAVPFAPSLTASTAPWLSSS